MAILARAQHTISDTHDPIVSATAPENPVTDMLWMDTSDPSKNILKRWDGEAWVETTIDQEDIDSIVNTINESASAIQQLENAITMKVWQTDIKEGLNGKADSDWVERRLQSVQEQTANDITYIFEQSKTYTEESISGLEEFRDEVKAYQRFSADGLELGQVDSPFIAKLGTTKLSFQQNGVEIAYISNNKLYITEAQVTDKLSIGTDDYGYFEWVTTPIGLGLKRRVVV